MTQVGGQVEAAKLRLRIICFYRPSQGPCGQCNCNDLMGGALLFVL